MINKTQKCSICKKIKKINNFYIQKPNRYHSYCKECMRKKTKEWYYKHHKQACEAMRKQTIRRKQEIINAYGGKCVCCGEKEFAFLTVDHIYGGGEKHRKEIGGTGMSIYSFLKNNNYPKDKYRLLCMNCNHATRFGRRCPHDNKSNST